MNTHLRYRTYHSDPGIIAPDPEPLRRDPVRREEVRLYRERAQLWITMPIGTFGRTECGDYVGDPTLWQPLLDHLGEARYAAQMLLVARDPIAARIIGTPRREALSAPIIPSRSGCEYICDNCGRRFLSPTLAGSHRVRLCSDTCQRARRSTIHRLWRRANPPANQAVNAARTRRRAEARAGRVCEGCGVAIEAARSTRRYCSNICRVRAHRQAADDAHSLLGGPTSSGR